MIVRLMISMRPLLTAALLGGAVVANAAPVLTSTGYVLGPDDSVQVVIYGQPDASITTRIKSDGTIVMPLIGAITAAGQTNISLADLITQKFEQGGYFKKPIVNVEIGGYVSKRVNVAGRVATPGVVPLDRDYHVLEMLLRTGWVRDNGASYVYLRRADGREVRLEADQLVRGTPDKDPLLVAGDTLYVPEADTFFIYGAINRAGTQPVLPGMTVRQALAVAGGVTATGSDRKVSLFRGGKEADAGPDEKIQKNDVILIKERLF